MSLQEYLDQRNISKYRLAQISGVPKTTIMDICAGRSDLSRCSARTVLQLARALDCTMEELMDFTSSAKQATGLSEDKSHLESGFSEDKSCRGCGLPEDKSCLDCGLPGEKSCQECGLPEDKSYLECGLPEFLQKSLPE